MAAEPGEIAESAGMRKQSRTVLARLCGTFGWPAGDPVADVVVKPGLEWLGAGPGRD